MEDTKQKVLATNCKILGENYTENYNKLIGMVKNVDSSTNNDEDLRDVTSKIKSIINKTLLSEDEFIKLKNQHSTIMDEFDDLKGVDKNPFTTKALELTENKEYDFEKIIKKKI